MSASILPVGRPQRIALALAVLTLMALAAAGTLWPRPEPAAANPLTDMTSVAAGDEFSCAVTAGGGASCWGNNALGQLGDGTATSRGTPREVSGLTGGVAGITAGVGHACALTVAGGVKCWGTGHGSTPADVPGLTSGVAAVAAGGYHTCALTTAGGVKCWGGNSGGQLGDGSTTSSSAPVDVSGLTSGVAAITGGGYHTCALTTAGGVKCWGRNEEGQVGDGSTTNRHVPVDVSGLTDGATGIAAGALHSCAVVAAGGVKCWGLGLGTVPADVPGFGGGAAAIAAGALHTCVLTNADGLECWGDNSFGQLGDGTTTNRTSPVDVSGLESGVTAVAGGGLHTCAVTTTGGLKCWGQNADGQLGDGTGGRFLDTVVEVLALSAGVDGVAAGGSHTCALMAGGDLECFGSNRDGQLGGATTEQCHLYEGPCSSTPVEVLDLAGGAAAVSGGESHTCAVTTGAGAKCWGDNGSGRLGDGTTMDRSTPVDVSGLTANVSAVAAGGRHTCALTATGGVKCWGHNYYGQLGDGTTTNSTTPVDVSGLASGVAAVAAGKWHTCAVTTGGGIKCWGSNVSGQLGANTTEDCEPGTGVVPCSTIPIDVPALTSGVAEAAAGDAATCALTTAGGVKCWGENSQGQVGDGTTTDRSAPVDVSGLTSGVAAIAAGGTHACALTGSGGVRCWGDNRAGQMGDGNAPLDALAPVLVPGLESGAASVAAGGAHTCAVTTAGGLKCWGSNVTAQLGIEVNVLRTTPVNVVGLVPKPTPTATPCSPEGCPTPTATPPPPPQTGLDFSLGIDVDGDTSNDCDTGTGPTTCSIPAGGAFTARVSLNSLPVDVPDYEGFDILLRYAGVSSKNNATAMSWPDCVFQAAHFGTGYLAWGCTVGIAAPLSAYTGVIGTNGFHCLEDGSITMAASEVGDTQLVGYRLQTYREGADETLVIDCVEPPTPPSVGGGGHFPDAHAADGSGWGAGTVTGPAFCATAGLIALSGVAWYAGRRRQR